MKYTINDGFNSELVRKAVFDGKLDVNYSKLSIVSLAAIDKLYEEIEMLKERIKVLEENK